jgi:hypothetical protein
MPINPSHMSSNFDSELLKFENIGHDSNQPNRARR